jgi:hypothetical protein
MSVLLALCGLALLIQHVAELRSGSNFQGDHLVAGVLMLALAVIVWFYRPNPIRNSVPPFKVHVHMLRHACGYAWPIRATTRVPFRIG